jgi:Spy/CpxP family protein refolding chaperone
MKNSLLKFALAASLVLNLTVIATAGYNYYEHSRTWVTPLGKVMDKDRFLFEDLSLKPAQLNALKNKAVLFHREIDSRRLEIDEKRKGLIALLRLDDPDQKSIDEVIKDINDRQEVMQKMVTRHMLEIKASLDKDQRQKFFDLIEGAMIRSGGGSCTSNEGTIQQGELHR